MNRQFLSRYRERQRWEKTGPWKIVYGRRKVGKSFFVKNETGWDKYYFITHGGSVIDVGETKSMNTDEFYGEFFALLGKERIVVDEFQRLPRDFLDRIHARGREGELTLISSSLFAVKRIFGRGSPIIGLFDEIPFGLISPADALWNMRDVENAVETAAIVRDPWTYDGRTYDPARIAAKAGPHVGAIVAEIFAEEERTLTEIYRGALEAVAAGANTTGKIASFLSGRRIAENKPGILSGYISVLRDLGIIKRIRVHGVKNRYIIRHASPIFDLYYYMMDRYGYPDTDLPLTFIAKILERKMPGYVEDFVRELLSEYYGLPEGVWMKAGEEIDIALGWKGVQVIGEVKWTEKVDRKTVRKIENKMARFENAEKVLIVKRPENVAETDIKVIGPEDLIKIAEDVVKRRRGQGV